MPELNGIEATRRLAASAPHSRVLALSMHKDSVYVREILRAGARGYLLKDSRAPTTWSPPCARWPPAKATSAPAVSNAVLDDYRRHVTNPIDLLTSREREVLQMLAEGKTNKEIAVHSQPERLHRGRPPRAHHGEAQPAQHQRTGALRRTKRADRLNPLALHIARRFGELPQVVAVALAGSSATGSADERSDLDLYVYALGEVPLSFRRALAACGNSETGE